jgi:hypothetical protein
MSINNVNRPQSQPLATDVSSGGPTRGATPKRTPVEVQTPKFQTGFLAKMKAGLSGLGSGIRAGFTSLTRGSAQSAPPGPARATTAAVNDQAKVVGQAKAGCTFLLRSVATPSLTGLPVVNVAMAKGALTELLDLPKATRKSSLQSLVKAMSGAELSHAAEGLSQLSAALAGPARAGGLPFKQFTASGDLRDIVGQEQRSRALTPDNFGKLASMVADGNKITMSQLAALPETHPARALFSAYLGKESSVENFNFCKAMAAVEAQTDPAKQNAMLKEIAEHVMPDDLNLNSPQQEKLKSLFMMGAASQTGNYSACLPALRGAAVEIERMANKDTMKRFNGELTKDLAQLAPKAYQSDLVTLSRSNFTEGNGPALAAIINTTMASNRAADPFADFFGADNLEASTNSPKFAALLDNTPEPAPLSDAPGGRAMPPSVGAGASAQPAISPATSEPVPRSEDPLSMVRSGRPLIDSISTSTSASTPPTAAAQGYSQILAQVIGGLGPTARGMEETLFQAMSAGVPRHEIENNISLAVKNSAISQREADALLSLIPAWNGRAAASPVTAGGLARVTGKSANFGAITSASTPALSSKFQPLTDLQFMYRDEHVNSLVLIYQERARTKATDVVFMSPVSSLESANLVEIFKAGAQDRLGTNFKMAVPIHTGLQDRGHWTGAFVEVNTDNKMVTIRGVDSLDPKRSISPDILGALTSMFTNQDFFPDFELSVSVAQPAYLQGNTLSCGPCTMENLLHLAMPEARPGDAQSTDMAALRQRQAELMQSAG